MRAHIWLATNICVMLENTMVSLLVKLTSQLAILISLICAEDCYLTRYINNKTRYMYKCLANGEKCVLY